MQSIIDHSLDDAYKALEQLKSHSSSQFIQQVAKAIADCFERGGKILLAGNGGSLCDAMHFAEELTGFFRTQRKSYPALVLNEVGHITCVGNDAGFEFIFERGVQAFGKPEDIFIGLTTSGNSPNIVRAMHAAKQIGMKTIGFLGKDGGLLKGFCDWELHIENFKDSDRIQEAHMVAIHIIIDLCEKHLGII
jgi:D-sedoheptulose 7-phosphate isomerase